VTTRIEPALSQGQPLGDPNESLFEETTIERLENLGYQSVHGRELRDGVTFPETDVVHRPTLRQFFREQYPFLDEAALTQAIQTVASPDGVDLIQRNKKAHHLITKGFDLAYEAEDGSEAYEHVYPIDWENPEENEFWVVQQLPVHGDNDRRPDLIIYVNGLPLVTFELKSPYREEVDVENAFNQLQHYRQELSRLFTFNAFCVLSDGRTTLHGVHSASREWFKPWMSADGETVADEKKQSMRMLVQGLFPKDRLLHYVRNFIVHENTGGGIRKKGALYHQFFGVRRAVEETLRATQPEGDQKIGVIWHTQGAGKSLSMVFLVGILRRRLGNPTILIEVDRNDLDEQLYDAFVAAGPLVGDVHQAEGIDDLRARLQTEGGEVVFTTIEKFQLKGEETEHPQLSDRNDVVVIADEAHRTQYGFEGEVRVDEETGERFTAYGYARYLRQALPNASFIGFTGTPIAENDRNTTAVFGDLIHTYDMQQAKEDGAVVGIQYEPRLIELALDNEAIDEDVEDIAEDGDVELEKQKWSALERAAGTDERQARLAEDIVEHFRKRRQSIDGKGMIVGMSRRNCMGLYEAIVERRPEWHDPALDAGKIKVVMTGNISSDPPEWNERGHITTKQQRDQLKQRFKDPDDDLQLTIVCDMWLTGTNIPCLHTLYVDKPMKGHNLMQAIARVNRVFRDKPAGLVVDYIGIGTELKKATKRYTDQGFDAPTEELEDAAFGQFEEALAAIRETLPDAMDQDLVAHWRGLSKIDFEDLTTRLYNYYLETDDRRDDFLRMEKRLRKAHSLIQHREEVEAHADEVAFYQLVRTQLKRTKEQATREEDEERAQAIRDLVERSLEAEEAVDIYEAAGIDKPDISILNEAFLEEFKTKEKKQSLRMKLLEKLMKDEIQVRKRENLSKYRTLEEILEETLAKYHQNTITAAEVMKKLVEMRKDYFSDDERKDEYNLSNEEIAFIDAINEVQEDAYDMPFLCDLVRDVVQSVKDNLEVDWTKPHRENVQASVRSAVKRVLRRNGVTGDEMQAVQEQIMEQAESLYGDWPKESV
jgi:type I restriction enzyme R subunit